MSRFLERLNPDQRAVALERGHCQAIACPGAGKTGTLAAKAAMLLDEGAKVCAVTFTKEAALELRERIVTLAGNGCKSRLLVATFHSTGLFMAFPKRQSNGFAGAILREQRSPFLEQWDFVNAGEQYNFVKRAIVASGLDLKDQEALFIIEEAKQRGSVEHLEDEHRTLVETYIDLLKRSGKIDLQDIILLVNRSLRDGTMSTLAVDQLLVDEYQDTDEPQYEWIAHHARSGVSCTVVGDDDQSIYGFRRALGFDGLTRFAKEFKAKRVLLGVNYRSRAEILSTGERLISKNTERIAKTLHAHNGPGGLVIWDSFPDVNVEAAAVAEEARIAIDEGASFAVLSRTTRELMEIQAAMVARKIPFRMKEGKSIFDHPEVQIYFALLRTLVKPVKKDIDLILGGIGMTEGDITVVHRLFNGAIRIGSPSDYTNSGITDAGKKVWRDFAKIHGQWCSKAAQPPYEELNKEVGKWLEGSLTDKFRSYIIEQAAGLFYIEQGDTLENHLANLKATESSMSRGKKEKSDTGADAKEIPWLMTAHGSKGLEFDRIWIVGLNHGSFPSDKSSLEEERRLFFVAITRARLHLTVSATQVKKPSLFAFEAGLIEQATA